MAVILKGIADKLAYHNYGTCFVPAIHRIGHRGQRRAGITGAPKGISLGWVLGIYHYRNIKIGEYLRIREEKYFIYSGDIT
jgi:hypothetical protein